MVLDIVLIIVSFVALIRGADFFVKGAASMAVKLGMSAFVAGLTIVSIGTSAPELFINIFAVMNGSTDLSIGNILGSNIADILLGLGIAATITPLAIKKQTVWKEIPFSLLATTMIIIFGMDHFIEGVGENAITRIEGISLLAFFIIFVVYTFGLSNVNKPEDQDEEIEEHSYIKSIFYILGGVVALVVGGKIAVNSASSFALSLGISENLVGLTIVAAGTSLPEIVTAVVAARKKQIDLVVGGIVGTIIFNSLFALGATAVFGDLPFSKDNIVDAVFLGIVSATLFSFMFLGKKNKLEKKQGIIFVATYVIYIILAVVRG